MQQPQSAAGATAALENPRRAEPEPGPAGQPPDTARTPHTRPERLRQRMALWLFIVPALVMYIATVIAPSLQSIEISLTDWDGVNAAYNYIGFANYTDIVQADRFWNAVTNTLLLGFGSAVIINVISLGVALLLDRLRHWQGLFRTLVYLPSLMSGFIAATIWKYILNYNFGVVNTTLREHGMETWAKDWFGDSGLVIWVLLFVLCFTLGGNTTLIYLANLQSVPRDLVEAARIDGASGLQVFRYVTWPMLAGSVTVNMTLGIIAGWTIFDQILVLTAGGPGFVSETMAFFIYKVGFGEYRAGYGSAAAVLLFLVVMATTVGANHYMRRREIQA
ncbi:MULTISPECIES: carbohydrate ABC transporter permease [Micromonospora]|nr:sugar ABC transporter permease [Micromonospora haikouensis]